MAMGVVVVKECGTGDPSDVCEWGSARLWTYVTAPPVTWGTANGGAGRTAGSARIAETHPCGAATAAAAFSTACAPRRRAPWSNSTVSTCRCGLPVLLRRGP
ncbi:hypothetical protein SCA03_04650 [Streptomyces cacaoi]|uniref:Uncharacterized protein n=1 Tax=Streptomyces cacaoi TaxID=1898 RepID=A0A4Y3QR92_STRCI|nr:hypothetical protein SCA03_04650 [Streptomyces cacaoi]